MRSWPSILPEEIRCPTLLLAGTKNQGALKWAKAHQAAPTSADTQVEVLEGLNHSQEFSDIERVFSVVSSFFHRHRSMEGLQGVHHV
jgi:hypothetical protein